MERDRDTIGLTPHNQSLVALVENRGWFIDAQDFARFCLAYAVRARVGVGRETGTDTRWSAGNFDRTGEIRALLSAVYPDCETPVRLMEHLVNQGMILIEPRLSSATLSPADLLE